MTSPDKTYLAWVYHDASYLVSRGVRPMALVESVIGDEAFQAAREVLFERVAKGSIPWTFEIRRRGEETAYELGYVAEKWAFDLYAWSFSPEVPGEHAAAILGLLLGYNASAIEGHINKYPGKGKRAQWRPEEDIEGRGFHGTYDASGD